MIANNNIKNEDFNCKSSFFIHKLRWVELYV